MRKPGIYNNLDIDEYHAEDGISSTGISLILDCPARYYYEYQEKKKDMDLKEAKKSKDKYKMGRAVHMLALEPDRFNHNFYCMNEEVNLTTKIGKEMYAEAEKKAQGRDILRKSDWDDIQIMAEAIKKHSIWGNFKNPLIEQSIFWDGGIGGTRLRARPDVFNDKVIIDIKTTDSISGFQRSLHSYGYHRQAAMQIDGLYSLDKKERHFAFFVVEKKAPHLTAIFELDPDSIAYGREQYIDGAAKYSECMATGVWPGYSELVQTITLPSWAKKTEDEIV